MIFTITKTFCWGGDEFGAEKLKIGEIAKRANVTKRTVDYYTQIGLIKARRTASNYRYYDAEALDTLKYIEQCKRNSFSLEEIKNRLKEKESDLTDYETLKVKISGLDKELSELLQNLEDKGLRKEALKKHLSAESISLMQTILLLLM
ncbi:MerR family transcriptional regulator [Bacillus infantis]|uniref:MerR family transcriptional regulator n=1 Tax=Bacillus infantis TaxID=324767 RepID=UPI0021550F5E|nr:MerR family transcriptional regulator [Bacillus infantis]MCR6610973.1 MerR family transcriptional regulator [Bacillus infantis]